MNIAILGAGITGLASALALHKHLSLPQPTITIYEIRDSPSTIGGSVNLTPKALRYLQHLGIDARGLGAECKTIELYDLYTGNKYGEVGFHGPEGRGIGKDASTRFYAARVMRSDLQAALLDAIEKQSDVKIVWGQQVVAIEERDDQTTVQLAFADGKNVICDLLLGCDGIHSATRKLLIEPERKPKYTGICVAMTTVTLKPETQTRWQTTGLVTSRTGSIMGSYFEPSRTEQYVAAVMEIEEIGDRQGWKVRSFDQSAIRADVLNRFRSEAMPELQDLVEGAGDWTLYPVHMLPVNGKWISAGGRAILLGDSAHAVGSPVNLPFTITC